MLDFLHFIFVVGETERSVNAQSVIHGAKDFAVELELYAGVHGFAVVDGERCPAGGRVEVGDGEQVGAEFVIPVDGAAQAVAEEREVEADVPRGGLLPAQIVVGRRVERSHFVAGNVVYRNGRGEERRHGLVDVAREAVAEAEFQHVEPGGGRLHELFVVHVPAPAY